MTNPPPLPDAAAATLDDFFTRLRDSNPFTDNRVTGPAPDEVDVEALNQAAFERLVALAREALAERRGLGAVVWGQAGIGKSHLLGRLGRWAQQDEQACLVYLHNLQASPDNLPRTLLRAVIDALTWRQGHGFHDTHLFRLIHTTLRDVLGDGTHSWGRLERALREALGEPSEQGPGDAALADRTVQGVLFQFFRSVLRAGQRKEDGTAAAAAVRWLRGEALDPDDAEKIGLPPGRQRGEPVALEDNQQIKQVFVALTALCAGRGQPFVLCFDQVDNLDEEQFAALGRFLEALIDSARNLLVVTAGIQASLVAFKDQRVIQESAWDRLAQFQLPLQRITPAQGRPLIEKRLANFLAPFDDVDEVVQFVFDDALFPLGSRWYDEAMRDRLEVRPRDVINDARERWHEQQQILSEKGETAWLELWQPDAVLDAVIERKMAEHCRAAGTRVPDADSAADSVADLLEQCQRLDGDYGLLEVERVDRARNGATPTYHLLLRQRGVQPGTEVRTGMVFALKEDGRANFHVLDRLRDDADPPQRVLLVTDEDGPDVGSKGEKYLDELRQRLGSGLKVMQLSRADFAAVDALHAVWNLAKDEALAATLPDGRPHRVTPEEVEASHHRRGRYRALPLLAEVFTVPESVAVPQPAVPSAAQTIVVSSMPVHPSPEEELEIEETIALDEPADGILFEDDAENG